MNQPGGLRRGVGVKRRLGEVVITEPETEAEHIPGISLPGNRIDRGRLLDSCVAEAGDGDVKGVPEVMHRAGLARVVRGECLQQQVDLAEYLPVAGYRRRVVAGVFGVLGEGSLGIGRSNGRGWAMVTWASTADTPWWTCR